MAFFLASQDEMAKMGERISTWNPFNDAEPFGQMSEDHIFGAEFDKIRQGGSHSSKGLILFVICLLLDWFLEREETRH